MNEPLPLSLLNDYLYCPRRAALKIVEGCREANEHTARGDIVHEHADLAGYQVRQGVTSLRALPVFSEQLGLNGKCDVVEVDPVMAGDRKPQVATLKSLKPVEIKLGKRRRWENDDAQLCAQALCLEEMFGVTVPRGAVFHAESKRRREVEFTPELRALIQRAAGELHALCQESRIADLKREISPLPPAVLKPACEQCSLYEVCLPQVTSRPDAAAAASRALFQV